MSFVPIDDRQVVNRAILNQLFPYVGSQTLDVLMASINTDLTIPLNVTASNPASLVINVGPALVVNSQSNRQKSISFIGTSLPNTFAGTTVTFPASSGGNITTGQGGSYPLTLPSGDFVAILLSLNNVGTVIVAIGTPAGTSAGVVVPAPAAATEPFAYVILSNVGGTIQNVAQTSIYQFAGGGSGSSGGSAPTISIATTSSFSGGFSAAGSGTYTPPVGVLYVEVEMCAAGGGGGGSGTSGSGGSGGNGGNTTLGSSFLTANGGTGGNGGTDSLFSVPGGTATIGAGASGIAIQGGDGSGSTENIGAGAVNTASAAGGVNPFGGGGGGISNGPGRTGSPNTGAGGGGGGGNSNAACYSGGAGAAGGYLKAFVSTLASSYTYSIGTGGTAGTAGSGDGETGGVGAGGQIIIREYYQ